MVNPRVTKPRDSDLTGVWQFDPAFGGQAGYRLPPPSCSLDHLKKDYPMTKFISRFAKDESGATAIEYGLIAALIAVALITVLGLLSGQLNALFARIGAALDGAAPATK